MPELFVASWPQTVNFNPFGWDGLSAISNLLMALLNAILIVGIFFAWKTIREQVSQREATLLLWAMGRVTELKPKLDKLYTLYLEDPESFELIEKDKQGKLYQENHMNELAREISIEFQRLSYLAESGLISKNHFNKLWGHCIIKAWSVLEEWIKERRRFEANDNIRSDFEAFAKYCKEN